MAAFVIEFYQLQRGQRETYVVAPVLTVLFVHPIKAAVCRFSFISSALVSTGCCLLRLRPTLIWLWITVSVGVSSHACEVVTYLLQSLPAK